MKLFFYLCLALLVTVVHGPGVSSGCSNSCCCDTKVESNQCGLSKTQSIESNYACNCYIAKNAGFFSICTPKKHRCYNENSEYCLNPTGSVQTCVQGMYVEDGGWYGNCDYHDNICECGKNNDGCIITKKAETWTACSCNLESDGQCTGHAAPCQDILSHECQYPGRNYKSCMASSVSSCSGYKSLCDCEYKEMGWREPTTGMRHKGCFITNPAKEMGTACKCFLNGKETCKGTIVNCKDPNHAKCKNPDESKESCEQGGGDCRGYLDECQCKWRDNSCYLKEAAPKEKACRCKPSGNIVSRQGWYVCFDLIVDCIDPNHPKCKDPDTSKESCLQAFGSQCRGYEDECECDYFKSGCIISKQAEDGTACKCVKHGKTCSGYNVQCKDPNSPYCLRADDSQMSCEQGGGDCVGYNNCDCEKQGEGCVITFQAPLGSACKCEKNYDTCSGKIVECNDVTSNHCKTPDLTKKSCEQGGGDCVGYDYCDCEKRENGCIITLQAPPNFACKCEKNNDTCSGKIVACKDPKSNYCIQPDTFKRSCIQAPDGECSGYTHDCICKFDTSGCVITKHAKPNHYCTCELDLKHRTCLGYDVDCVDENHTNCIKPFHNKLDCLLGGGDCDGYLKDCKCKGNGADYGTGCNILKPAQPNMACKCKFYGISCGGYDVDCKNANSTKCIEPDRSKEACLQGEGECGGYDDCQCVYAEGEGCVISKSAQQNRACRCELNGNSSCLGYDVACKNPQAPLCISPDISKEACQLGEGNCGGYTVSNELPKDE